MEKPNILMVDDDKDFLDAVKTAIEKHGFKVTPAHDGEEGLKKAKKDRPQLVILDVMMPKKDGYAVCHDLKTDEATARIPVLMLTSLGDKAGGNDAAEALAKGHQADAFLEKPVEPEVLVEQVKALMDKAPQEDTGSKVLLIDDDPDFIGAVKIMLSENGYHVAVAYTGNDGIAAVPQEKPDIILLDVMLPEKDGFAVCKELKEDEKTRGIPVILMTSIGDKLTEPDYAKAMAITHKADDYLSKPVEPKELLKRIQKFIGPRRRLV